MKLIHRIFIKAYYNFWNLLLPKQEVKLNKQIPEKRNLFIYFDYEREFSGHNTSVSNEDIVYLLNTLQKKRIISTWFTVGKIFEKYPESIQKIIEQGHEIASHTYSHISPLQHCLNDLEMDFKNFDKVSGPYYHVKGFHSPNGQWSIGMFKYLWKYKFEYDMFGRSKNMKISSHYLKYCKQKKLLRLIAIGDDWPLYMKDYSSEKVIDYFIELSRQIHPGEIAGIGFHPWVLFSDKTILDGFIHFLDYISGNPEFEIRSALSYVKELNQNGNN